MVVSRIFPPYRTGLAQQLPFTVSGVSWHTDMEKQSEQEEIRRFWT